MLIKPLKSKTVLNTATLLQFSRRVEVLPDTGGWLSSGAKFYETIVTIDEKVAQIKPGMTAVVEIHVDHPQDVLCAPIEAVVRHEDMHWCYVGRGSQLEMCPVEIGRMNEKYIEILSGISVGDRVVVNPAATLENDGQEESEGSLSRLSSEGSLFD